MYVYIETRKRTFETIILMDNRKFVLSLTAMPIINVQRKDNILCAVFVLKS